MSFLVRMHIAAASAARVGQQAGLRPLDRAGGSEPGRMEAIARSEPSMHRRLRTVSSFA
ncbi:MAG: hypothetical protein ACOYNZ_00045 [Rhodoferax sp.]